MTAALKGWREEMQFKLFCQIDENFYELRSANLKEVQKLIAAHPEATLPQPHVQPKTPSPTKIPVSS